MQKLLAHVKRSRRNLVPLAGRCVTCHDIEQMRYIRTQIRIRTEITNVGILRRRLVIVIARGQVHITPVTAILTPHHQQRFTMYLQTRNTVYYMRSGFLQLLRPDYVVAFVKSGLQLHYDRYLFAVLRRLLQRGNHRRVTADPVQRLLYRQNIRITRRLVQHLQHRIKTLKRQHNHYRLARNTFKKLPLNSKLRRGQGGPWFFQQIRTVHPACQFKKLLEMQWPIYFKTDLAA